jgi:hypothetical protein
MVSPVHGNLSRIQAEIPLILTVQFSRATSHYLNLARRKTPVVGLPLANAPTPATIGFSD